MSRASTILVSILAMVLVFQPVFSWAGPGARVIPQGEVSLLEDGRAVSQFQSELPLPEGTLMLCSGSCLVQTQNLQLVALDQAVFALAEGKDRWDLTVKSGQIDFAIRSDAKPVSFHTPHDTIQAEGSIVPASGSATVKGSIKVSETESVLSIQEGAMQVMSPGGTVLVQPGKVIRLAQAQMTPKATAPAANSGGTTASGGYTTWTWAGVLLGTAAIATPPAVLETTKSTSVSPQ